MCSALLRLLGFISIVLVNLECVSQDLGDRVPKPNKQDKYIEGTQEYITFKVPGTEAEGKELTRRGILLLRPGSLGTVVICHGFMCNKVDIGFLRMMFKNFNVVTFDFRAHGECDTEQCCTFGKDEALDVAGVVQYLKLRQDLSGPRFAYGFSMGAVAAIIAQATDPTLFDAMILDCPYDHSINVIKRGLENLKLSLFGYTFALPGRSFLEQYAFQPWLQSILKTVLKTVAKMDATVVNTQIYPVSPADFASKITIPCFFIHCKNDEKVDVNAAHTLYNNVKGYKRLWLTAGRHHFDSFFFNPEKYFGKVDHFLHDVMTLGILNKKKEKIVEDV
jgi:uncharacterized protein